MATRDTPRSTLYDIAERQAGYFTAAQALEVGYSYASQGYNHRAGNWLRDGWGIYRLAHFPASPAEPFVRLMLWSRDRTGQVHAAVSHDSALQAYDLSDVLPPEIHLTVPRTFRKSNPEGVVLHRADLTQDDVRMRDGYRITTPLRTILDVAASPLSPEHLEAATTQALEQGLVRRSELDAAISHDNRAVILEARLAALVP